jgi:hypothetical protein
MPTQSAWSRVRIVGVGPDDRPRSAVHGDFDARVCPRATGTVISRRVARLVGVQVWRRWPTTVWGLGRGGATMPVGLAVVKTPKGYPLPMMVGVSDAVTRRFGAEVVLGGNYHGGMARIGPRFAPADVEMVRAFEAQCPTFQLARCRPIRLR